jgi:FKBP-type peptidyl-prolyl cis-trans isomerase (trigger factor)
MAKEIIVELPENMSESDVEEALALLEAKRERYASNKQKRAEKMSDPEFREAMKKTHSRYQAKRAILVKKAIEAGLEVTDQEIDEYLAA